MKEGISDSPTLETQTKKMPEPKLIILEGKSSNGVGTPEVYQEKRSPKCQKGRMSERAFGVTLALGNESYTKVSRHVSK